MGNFYGIKIINNMITIEAVPKLWRKAVEKWLAENAAP